MRRHCKHQYLVYVALVLSLPSCSMPPALLRVVFYSLVSLLLTAVHCTPAEGLVGVSQVCILGYNRNKGQEISLRLRTDDYAGFRKYLAIRKTLVHELTHNVSCGAALSTGQDRVTTVLRCRMEVLQHIKMTVELFAVCCTGVE